MPGARSFPIILPSETQSREFDAKLLLAGMLAERGHPVVVGSRMEIHNRIHQLPRGLYVAKDLFRSSRRMFRIMEQLGFGIVAWDEEAIVTADAKTYHERRVDTENLNRIRAFLAWGANNRELIETAPGYCGTLVYETGNPRTDLYAERCRGFFAPEAQALRDRFGEFILINSNFGQINHFLESDRVRRLPDGSFVNIAAGNPDWWAFRFEVFESFLKLVPALARAFPDRTVVIRPHPAEAHEVWREAGQGLPNVEVIHEGHVAPWLLASAVAIHNGCTTGLESYLLGHPVVTYRAVRSEKLDDKLPNLVSTPIFSQAEMIERLAGLFAGRPLPPAGAEARAAVEDQVGKLDGMLASERIDALIAAEGERWLAERPPLATRVEGYVRAVRRRSQKLRNARIPGHKNSAEYTAHRFAGLDAIQTRSRLARLGSELGRFDGLKVKPLHPNVFLVTN